MNDIEWVIITGFFVISVLLVLALVFPAPDDLWEGDDSWRDGP